MAWTGFFSSTHTLGILMQTLLLCVDRLPQVQLPSVTKCAGGADLLTGTCGDAPTGSGVAVLDPRWPEGGNCGGV